MKLIVVFVPLIAMAIAQRPTYAGTAPIGRPGLANRFRDPNEESTTVGLGNRIGEDGSTLKIPVDARGDSDLVDRLNQWPREHRPFWLLNAEHIEASRNTQVNPDNQAGGQAGVQQQNNNLGGSLPSRGSFESANNVRPVRPEPLRPSFAGGSQ